MHPHVSHTTWTNWRSSLPSPNSFLRSVLHCYEPRMGPGPSVIMMLIWVSQHSRFHSHTSRYTFWCPLLQISNETPTLATGNYLWTKYLKIQTWKIGINIHVKEMFYVKIKDYRKKFMSMEHWPSLTGLTPTSIPKQFLVLGQNMTPLSDKHRTFLCKLYQFSKPESLKPRQFCKDPITTLMLSEALVGSGTASALFRPIYSNHQSNTFHS